MRSIRTIARYRRRGARSAGLAACGSSASGSSTATGSASVLEHGGLSEPATESLSGKRGGTLVVLQESDFEHLDPGIAYYSLDYAVVFATQRPLYSNKPDTRPNRPPTWPPARRKSPRTTRRSRCT